MKERPCNIFRDSEHHFRGYRPAFIFESGILLLMPFGKITGHERKAQLKIGGCEGMKRISVVLFEETVYS